jgi:ribonuclease E
VEQRLRDAMRKFDRARVQFSSISKFGLLELSRQRLRPALSEGSHITCPRCNGTGHIRDTESSALQILRMVQEEAMKDNTAAVHVQVPVEVTSFLLNEKRTEITKIELKQRVTVLLVPNKHIETPNYKLERLRHDDPRLDAPQGQLHHDRGAGRRGRHHSAREGQAQAGAGDQGRAAGPAGAAARADPGTRAGTDGRGARRAPRPKAAAPTDRPPEDRAPRADRGDRGDRGERGEGRRGPRADRPAAPRSEEVRETSDATASAGLRRLRAGSRRWHGHGRRRTRMAAGAAGGVAAAAVKAAPKKASTAN